MTSYDPWATVAAQPDIEVVVTRLPAGQAWWLPDLRGIVLDDRLTQAERRCALEHELQHAAAGDECLGGSGPDAGRLDRRRERATDARAAQRLITLDELADALAWALDPAEVADALHVDSRTVRARLRSLSDNDKAYIQRRLDARDGAA